MNQMVVESIVLRRTDYGEADRILSLICADIGKVSTMAKGVRKMKSKLAGGIELLAVNEVTLIKGKSDFYTLRSARMKRSFSSILETYERSQQAFSALKQVSKLVEEGEGATFYPAIKVYLGSLDDGLDLELADLWWNLRLLTLLGHKPNLDTDTEGNALSVQKKYVFIPDSGCFGLAGDNSKFAVGSEVIKLWRLALQLEPMSLMNIKRGNNLASSHLEPLKLFATSYI